MKKWTLVVVLLVRKLPIIYDLIDRKIQSIALSFGGDTTKQYDAILKLANSKDMLHNIDVIYDKMIDFTSEEDMTFIYDYIMMACLDMCEKYKMSRQGIWQKVKRKIEKASCAFAFFALDEKFMEKNYADIPLVRQLMARVSNK